MKVTWIVGRHQLNKRFYIAHSVVELGAMQVVIDSDGQRVVGTSGWGGDSLLGSVFADEIAIGHELGCARGRDVRRS